MAKKKALPKFEFLEIALDAFPPNEELSVLEPDNALIMSILQVGVLEPVIFTKYRNKLTFRAGNRRVKAARAALKMCQETPEYLDQYDLPNTKHLETITAKVFLGVDDDLGTSIALITNEQRSDNPIDAYQNIMYLQKSDQWEKLQAQFRMNPQKFKKLMTLTNLIDQEKVFQSIGEGNIAQGTMFALAKLSKERQKICMEILKNTGKLKMRDIKSAREATTEQVLSKFDTDSLKSPAQTDEWAGKFIVITQGVLNGPMDTYGDAHAFSRPDGGSIYQLTKVG
jgi:hypothetical protein